jgi:hypothetical protein
MKIAAVLFILSVCYIASTEQAAVLPTDVYQQLYPSRSWNSKKMVHKAQQGMEEFKMEAQNAKSAQTDIPTVPMCSQPMSRK